MYGTQTDSIVLPMSQQFENDVKMYGTQTISDRISKPDKFENDVKMYGTQTCDISTAPEKRLRMM